MYKNISVLLLLLVLAAGCTGLPPDAAVAPPLDQTRKVSEQDCTRAFEGDGGNLWCREITEAEFRARAAAAERQASARLEAEARALRERLERERAEQLAREEAARKAREAEQARLAAERRRLEEEAARKAKEERERREREEAARLARLKAEQEAREAAARECRRLEQERSEGRALLTVFVADYGKDEEFREIAGQIASFLAKPRKEKPCPKG